MPQSRRKLKTILIVEEGAGIGVLRLIAKRNEHVACIITSPTKAREARVNPSGFAAAQGWPTVHPQAMRSDAFVSEMQRAEVDLLLNVHSLAIVPETLLETARLGAFNMHPGPLPEYAGLNAPGWAICNGEAEHGVTVHRMVRNVDAGPIAYQYRFPIAPRETAFSLTLKCIRGGLPLMEQLLEAASSDPTGIPQHAQDMRRRHYFGARVPEQGWLRWERSANEIDQFVRAFYFHPFDSPWGYPKTKWQNQTIGVLTASLDGSSAREAPGTVIRCDPIGVHVACGEGSLLVRKICFQGRCLAANELLRPGDRLESAHDIAFAVAQGTCDE